VELPHPQYPDYNTHRGRNGRNYPEAHRDFGFRPAFSFKMVVDRRRQKNFAVEKFLGKKLDNR